MQQIYGLGEQDIKRLGKALKVVENLPPTTLYESSSIPTGDRSRYYPFGNSFAFGIVYAPTPNGHMVLISQGFVHSPASNEPVLIEGTRYYVEPLNFDEKYLHVFIRFDTHKLTIVKSTTFSTFDEPSYHMTETPVTVQGVPAVSATEVNTTENEVDWANVQLLYTLRIKDAKLMKVMRADGAVSVKPDTEATASLDLIRKSIEIGSDPRCYQVYGFNGDSQVVDGLASLIESDVGTGAISAKTGAEKYEMLVRVRDTSGNIRVIGYMSIGTPPNPVDPTDPSTFENCETLPHPGDIPVDETVDSDTTHPGDLPDDISVDDPGDDTRHPAKTNPCW